MISRRIETINLRFSASHQATFDTLNFKPKKNLDNKTPAINRVQIPSIVATSSCDPSNPQCTCIDENWKALSSPALYIGSCLSAPARGENWKVLSRILSGFVDTLYARPGRSHQCCQLAQVIILSYDIVLITVCDSLCLRRVSTSDV